MCSMTMRTSPRRRSRKRPFRSGCYGRSIRPPKSGSKADGGNFHIDRHLSLRCDPRHARFHQARGGTAGARLPVRLLPPARGHDGVRPRGARHLRDRARGADRIPVRDAHRHEPPLRALRHVRRRDAGGGRQGLVGAQRARPRLPRIGGTERRAGLLRRRDGRATHRPPQAEMDADRDRVEIAQAMPTEILMPALSPTMEEGKLAKWLVKEGQTIKPGDIIAEIETDKATMEVEAVDEGKVSKLLVAEGTEGVKVNTPIAVLDGEAAAPAKKRASKGAPPATKSSTRPPPPSEGKGVRPLAQPSPVRSEPSQAR